MRNEARITIKVRKETNASNQLKPVRNTVQLKGNLTQADRLHATYWMKACSFINPYWHVWEGKLAKINFQKARTWAKKALNGYSHKYIPVPFSVYVHTYIATYVPSAFSCPTLCTTG